MQGAKHHLERVFKTIFVEKSRNFVGLVARRHPSHYGNDHQRRTIAFTAYASAPAKPNIFVFAIAHTVFQAKIVYILFYQQMLEYLVVSFSLLRVDERYPITIKVLDNFFWYIKISHHVRRYKGGVCGEIRKHQIRVGDVF